MIRVYITKYIERRKLYGRGVTYNHGLLNNSSP